MTMKRSFITATTILSLLVCCVSGFSTPSRPMFSVTTTTLVSRRTNGRNPSFINDVQYTTRPMQPVLSTRTRAASSIRRRPTTRSSCRSASLLSSASSWLPALHRDPSYCLTSLILLSTFGILLERRTLIGKALSAPLATMALALSIANLGMIPFDSPIYAVVNRFLVPLAVPMLLFDSDMNRVIRDTGSLLVAFGVGAVATVVGTVVAYALVPLTSLGPNVGWKIACALCARHIGGAINFVAVADTLAVDGTAVSATIAADNVVVALYFMFLFAISKAGETTAAAESIISSLSLPGNDTLTVDAVVDPEDASGDDPTRSITLPTLALALSIASVLHTFGTILTKVCLPSGTSSLPLTSVLTVVAATVWPRFFAQIRSAGSALGVLFIQMFFAASGAAGSIVLVLKKAPLLFWFSTLQISVHFGFLMTVGRLLFKLPARELYLSSNANVGGPTTAAAMAQAKEWNRLILPALLIGILGYATATAIALALGPVLWRIR